MNIYDFLPNYTEFNEDIEKVLGKELIEKNSLYFKKEFNDYKLKKIEDKPKSAGVYMDHQIIMSYFLSSYTPYDGVLVMHEPGTGKTCLSVATIEKIRMENSIYKGALILMKGNTLIENYKRELVDKCTDNIYKIKDENENIIGYEDANLLDSDMTENKLKRRINKKLASFYKFHTFETFSKILSNMSDEDIIKTYSNHIIVIDEVHHLRITDENDKDGQYNNIYKLLHIVENCKKILMSGTPMIDSPQEFASLMNLILEKKNQLPIGENFLKEYMIKDKETYLINPEKENKLKKIIYGKVSFLRSMQSSIKREYVGEKINLKYFNQFGLKLKEIQLKSYKEALKTDKDTKGIFINSQESSLFIYPDGSYGKKGFEKYVVKDKCKKLFDFFKNKNIEEKLEILSNYSIKYSNCIKLLLNNEGNHFVYIDFVKGSGAIVFSEILKQFGFSNFKDNSTDKNFAILTSKTSSDINKAIKIFNKKSNINGKNIKVIIGSKIISEGFSLKNVRHVHILTPHWNFSETDQAIARAFRLFSHNDLQQLIPDLTVKIYLYTILTGDKNILSIDSHMYNFCENKDISIKSIENLIKQTSFDCQLNKERNILNDSLDYSRNCEYQKCNYPCYNEKDEKDEIKLDYSTFNMYYYQNEMVKVINKLKELFLIKTEYDLYQLKEEFKNFEYNLLLKTILYLSHHKIIINKKFGINNYLCFKNNKIFLSNKIYNQSQLDSFYIDNIPLQFYLNSNEIFEKNYDFYLVNLFNKLKIEKDENKKLKILNKFEDNAKELLLELSILSKVKNYNNIDKIREYIIDKFSNFITKDKDIYYSNLLGKNKIRILKDDKWIDKKEDKKDKKDKEQDKENKKENEFGYEGFIEKNIFKIRNIDNIKNKGVDCKLSVKKDVLLKIIHILKIDPEKSYPEIFIKDEEELKKTIKSNSDTSFFDLSKLTKNDMIRINYWESKPKKDICKIIEKKFKEKGIFLY
jgi:hypothetical protein